MFTMLASKSRGWFIRFKEVGVEGAIVELEVEEDVDKAIVGTVDESCSDTMKTIFENVEIHRMSKAKLLSKTKTEQKRKKDSESKERVNGKKKISFERKI